MSFRSFCRVALLPLPANLRGLLRRLLLPPSPPHALTLLLAQFSGACKPERWSRHGLQCWRPVRPMPVIAVRTASYTIPGTGARREAVSCPIRALFRAGQRRPKTLQHHPKHPLIQPPRCSDEKIIIQNHRQPPTCADECREKIGRARSGVKACKPSSSTARAVRIAPTTNGRGQARQNIHVNAK